MPARIHYTCQRCTNCCRWPGFVKVSEGEIQTIASHLGVEEGVFIQKYTQLDANRRGLSLMDKENGECFFLEEGACAIQAAKPIQCQDFPNAWNFPGWREVCEAKPSLMSEQRKF